MGVHNTCSRPLCHSTNSNTSTNMCIPTDFSTEAANDTSGILQRVIGSFLKTEDSRQSLPLNLLPSFLDKITITLKMISSLQHKEAEVPSGRPASPLEPKTSSVLQTLSSLLHKATSPFQTLSSIQDTASSALKALTSVLGMDGDSLQGWILAGVLLHVLGSFLLLPRAPSTVLASPSRLWKWRSTYMARIAAAVTGFSSLLSLASSPKMKSDLMFGSSVSGSRLVAFSIGVHLAEALDMLCHNQLSNLFIHHVFVILCFSGSLITDKAVGFAVLSLVTEINSVFNKTRILHLVSGLSRASEEFQWKARINLATFAIRMVIIAWMNQQSLLYFGRLPLAFLLPCNFGLFFVNFWNISVFKQLFISDLVKGTTLN